LFILDANDIDTLSLQAVIIFVVVIVSIALLSYA